MMQATATITIGILLLQICLHFGLKYLWNIMNLIQFLIFMQMWLITLPSKTRIFLRELKQLALMEFIPYAWLKSSDDEEEQAAEMLMVEEIGIDRFGTNSLVDGMGAFLVIGIALGLVLLVLVLMRFIATVSPRVMSWFDLIKKKMQYNVPLRFVL